MCSLWDYHGYYARHCGHYRFCGLNKWRCHCRMECVTIDKSESTSCCVFKIVLDVDNFNAKELKVKAKDEDTIIVEGKKIEDNTKKTRTSMYCLTNEFIRSYKVPRHYNAKQAKVTLSADKILIITIAENKVDNIEQYIDIVESPETYENISNDAKDTAEVVLEKEEEEEVDTSK